VIDIQFDMVNWIIKGSEASIFRQMLPHFEKGGQGGISPRQSKANPHKSPFLKGGLEGI
jgi:hypothetical protein